MKRTFSLLVAVLMFISTAQAQSFGISSAVSGSEILVGEVGGATYPGTLYGFSKSADGTWTEAYQMNAPDGGESQDGFGRAVASNGQQLIVGSGPKNTAYIYSRNSDGGWDAGTALTASDLSEGDNFGGKVAIGNGFAAVAATGMNETAGAVYVFRFTDGAWVQEAMLAPEGLTAGANYGYALLAGDHTLLVGAPARAVGGFSREEITEVGAVYSYRYEDGAWSDAEQIGPQGVSEGGAFGGSLSASGNRIAVGAPMDNQGAGSVSLFEWDAESSSYANDGRLAPFVAGRSQFGSFVSLDEWGVFVGAPGDSRGQGSTYYFTRDEAGEFSEASKSGADGVSGRSSYGGRIAAGNGIAVISATGMDSRSGGAVVWEMSEESGWVESGVIFNEIRGYAPITEGEVRCESDKVADFACSNVDILSFLPLNALGASRGSAVNDIWGWSDPETGKEYAIVGRTDGTSFVDLTNPLAPIYMGNLPMTEGANPAIWRDMKVFKNHAFIVADASGQHGMQVFDLTRLRDMDGTNPPTLEADTIYDKIASSHNIEINEETGFGYSVGSNSGGETCGGGLHMIDLNDPKNPTFAGCFADPSTGRRGTGYSHDAQCVIYAGPDAEHAGKEICMGSNETALSIADVSDKDNPAAISSVTYPNVAYAHQGWLSEDHEWFYMNDEGDEPQGLVEGTRTLVWDVRDLDEPLLIQEYIAETTTTDHNLYIKGNLMYQSNYGSGLRILDISDRANPVEVGFLDTTPGGGMGSWSNYPYFNSGAIAVTSGGEGLFIVRKQDQGL
ncbi:MAG: choice-of-anchor B family protein [Bacteroidetes Order II. Incertae sedis bacterium]|nr:choice-of-anchor B family protein [Bacteroidetes Order II. bacterium]